MTDAPVLLRLRIAVWRLRGVLAVAGVAVLVLAAARTAAPPPPATTPVVVLARDVAAGTALADADLRVAHLPRCCVPAGTTPDDAALLGRTLAVAAPRGLPLVDTLLAGSRFTVDPPPGAVVVPVQLVPGAAATLRAGDRVDLVAPPDAWDPAADVGAGEGEGDGAAAEPDAGGPPVLARAALVVEVADAGDDGALGLGTAAGTGPAGVLVAVGPDEGRALAADAGSALGAVLVQ